MLLLLPRGGRRRHRSNFSSHLENGDSSSRSSNRSSIANITRITTITTTTRITTTVVLPSTITIVGVPLETISISNCNLQ
jgi:hypothetical protein